MNIRKIGSTNFKVIRVGESSVKALATKCVTYSNGIIEVEEETFENLVDGDTIWLKQVWTITETYRQLATTNVDASFARLLFYRYSEPAFTFVSEPDEAIDDFREQVIYTRVADISVNGTTRTLSIELHKKYLYIPLFEKPISTGTQD